MIIDIAEDKRIFEDFGEGLTPLDRATKYKLHQHIPKDYFIDDPFFGLVDRLQYNEKSRIGENIGISFLTSFNLLWLDEKTNFNANISYYSSSLDKTIFEQLIVEPRDIRLIRKHNK